MPILNLSKKYILVLLILISTLYLNYPEEKELRSIDSILSDIRKEQGLKDSDKINPDKVSPNLLEELGDAVMDKMIGDRKRHEIMDSMMGGEGSSQLSYMHQRIGYNYLTGNNGWFGNMMGMMYGYPYNNYYNNKGGFPMMWNNGYGMMGWGFGGWIIGLLFFIFLTAIVLIIYFALRISKGSLTVSSKDETALDILKKRYAKGEITKKEFIDMKKDL